MCVVRSCFHARGSFGALDCQAEIYMRAIHVPARTTFGFLIVSSLSLQPAWVSEATRVGTTGWGPIRFGMSVSQAARASGLELVPVHDPLGPDERVDCYYVKS